MRYMKDGTRMPKGERRVDRKSTRLNSSHLVISYAVFCLKKKKQDSQDLSPNTLFFFVARHVRHYACQLSVSHPTQTFSVLVLSTIYHTLHHRRQPVS